MTVKKKNINQKISSIAGWNPLPLSLKIFFIILSLGVISSIFSIGKNWYFLLGFIITGFVSKIILFLLNIAAPIMLLIAMWKRYSWTKRYAFVYLGFFILNNIIGIWNFFNV
jgi:hypothetical protein